MQSWHVVRDNRPYNADVADRDQVDLIQHNDRKKQKQKWTQSSNENINLHIAASIVWPQEQNELSAASVT